MIIAFWYATARVIIKEYVSRCGLSAFKCDSLRNEILVNLKID